MKKTYIPFEVQFTVAGRLESFWVKVKKEKIKGDATVGFVIDYQTKRRRWTRYFSNN